MLLIDVLCCAALLVAIDLLVELNSMFLNKKDRGASGVLTGYSSVTIVLVGLLSAQLVHSTYIDKSYV